MSIPVIGIDIGQKRDPTALAVVEGEYRSGPAASLESHFAVRFLERLPLGTPYPEVAHRLAEICQRVTRRSHHRPRVFVDATGVGQPIVDLLRDSTRHTARIWAVTFTHGDRRTTDRKERKVTLGKALLVCRLQSLLEGRRLHLPSTPEALALVGELLDYEIRIDDNARERYGAFRVGTHDDLVTALGLAVQEDPPAGDRVC